MEPSAAWGPSEFQLTNWTVEEPAAEAWAHAGGLPVEFIDTFGNCSLKADAANSSGAGQQQLVEYSYYYAAASRCNLETSDKVTQMPHGHGRGSESESDDDEDTTESRSGDKSPRPVSSESVVDIDGRRSSETRISMNGRARALFSQAAGEFSADIMAKEKMHRYPAGLAGSVDERYTAPMMVAIGPRHRSEGRHLEQAEAAKHAAAYHCVSESGSLLEDLYSAVVDASDAARRLYDGDAMAGIGRDDFRHMMFFDACFLVQFMLMLSGARVHPSLHRFLSTNRSDILHDVLLLDNQLPWRVVEAVMRFRPVDLDKFLGNLRGCLHDHKLPQQEDDDDAPPVLGDDKPLHLLGLFRYYIVGRIKTKLCRPETKNRSVSHSAMELEEIGITLTTNRTGKLIDMQLNQGPLFAELSLAPLSLDRDRASYLVNMAALELCTIESFSAADEDSAVCSYLLLLAMLAYREEDVHELRARGLLQGGGGLTNQEALAFFTSLLGLRLGSRYTGVMRQIESYKETRLTETRLHAFLYNHWKTIAAVGSAVAGVAGIIGTLASLKM
ncbi:hypothetical protein C2845_PM04G15450 [Panicum miliaceum]|uniref:Uncharacterized protein n=1 Tax=Panicum miliaceum TaxID=4540 RepID=A0A3L6QRH6_PANMI|nr:hypothetical protein C2845_PM04G15450 [Panicum miliaceum]